MRSAKSGKFGAMTCSLAMAALSLMGPRLAQAADQPAEANFRIAEAALAMPVPSGLCVPAAQVAALSQMTSAADPSNVTVADFWNCGAPELAGSHYVLLKVPTQVLVLQVEKADALKQLEAVLSAPGAPMFDGSYDAAVKEGIDKVTGMQTKLKSNFGYIGRDADCLYMGGRVDISIGAAKTPTGGGLVAVCMTVVGKKLLSVNVYDARPGADIKALTAEAHALSQTIHPANPAN